MIGPERNHLRFAQAELYQSAGRDLHSRQRRQGHQRVAFARDLDVQAKTAFVLAHKLREAMASEMDGHVLNGEVEIDGAHFSGHVRPENRKEDRIDRRLAEHQTGKRRTVVVMRQRKGRTLPFVVNHPLLVSNTKAVFLSWLTQGEGYCLVTLDMP